jgi:hypothetical protein
MANAYDYVLTDEMFKNIGDIFTYDLGDFYLEPPSCTFS